MKLDLEYFKNKDLNLKFKDECLYNTNDLIDFIYYVYLEYKLTFNSDLNVYVHNESSYGTDNSYRYFKNYLKSHKFDNVTEMDNTKVIYPCIIVHYSTFEIYFELLFNKIEIDNYKVIDMFNSQSSKGFLNIEYDKKEYKIYEYVTKRTLFKKMERLINLNYLLDI